MSTDVPLSGVPLSSPALCLASSLPKGLSQRVHHQSPPQTTSMPRSRCCERWRQRISSAPPPPSSLPPIRCAWRSAREHRAPPTRPRSLRGIANVRVPELPDPVAIEIGRLDANFSRRLPPPSAAAAEGAWRSSAMAYQTPPQHLLEAGTCPCQSLCGCWGAEGRLTKHHPFRGGGHPCPRLDRHTIGI